MPARRPRSGRKPSARKMLASELARLREESGWTLAELADQTTYDRTHLHKMETGHSIGGPEVIAALDKVYETGSHLELLWELSREDAFMDRYTRFMQLERDATVMHMYSASVVPGLLQTEAYAREVLQAAHPRDEHKVEEQLAARLGRQDLLFGDSPPHFRTILDEAVFWRALRDPQEWRHQLAHLRETADLSHVVIQVLPYSAGLHDLVGGSATVLWQTDGSSQVYLEGSKSGDLVEDPAEVEDIRVSYDLLRDAALPPRESASFIERVMEDKTCTPLAPT